MPPFVESFLWIEFANDFFFTIRLLTSQIWAILERTASSANFNHYFLSFFDLRVTRSVVKVGFLSLTEPLVGFKQRTWFKRICIFFFSKTKRWTGNGIWKLCRWNSCYSHWNSQWLLFFYLAVAGNNQPFRVTPPTSSG